MPDAFALALLSWFVVCTWATRRHRLRLEAMIVMLGGWVASVTAQYWLSSISPTSQFVLIDLLILALLFSLLAHRSTKWVGVAVICHGAMLVGHSVHYFSGWPSAGLYVGYLNALGYFSAGAIAGGPMVGAITDRVRAYHARHAHLSWGSLRDSFNIRRNPSHPAGQK